MGVSVSVPTPQTCEQFRPNLLRGRQEHRGNPLPVGPSSETSEDGRQELRIVTDVSTVAGRLKLTTFQLEQTLGQCLYIVEVQAFFLVERKDHGSITRVSFREEVPDESSKGGSQRKGHYLFAENWPPPPLDDDRNRHIPGEGGCGLADLWFRQIVADLEFFRMDPAKFPGAFS